MRALLGVAVLVGFAACESSTSREPPAPVPLPELSRWTDGQWPVQSASYDDATGRYRVVALGGPDNVRPYFEAEDLQLARAEDGKNRLEIREGQPVLHITEDFKLDFVHNVIEERRNAQGQVEPVVVRQEGGSWMPFAAGMMMGNMFNRPMYMLPPVYSPTGMRGVGAAGATPMLAAQSYQQQHGALPQSTRLRTSGALRSGVRYASPNAMRPTGSGVSASKLRRSDSPIPARRGTPFGRGMMRRR